MQLFVYTCEVQEYVNIHFKYDTIQKILNMYNIK